MKITQHLKKVCADLKGRFGAKEFTLNEAIGITDRPAYNIKRLVDAGIIKQRIEKDDPSNAWRFTTTYYSFV